MQFELLKNDDYYARYEGVWEEVEGKSVSATNLERDFEELDARLTKLFEAEGWETEEDFELMFEWQHTYHHCGGIYSTRIHSPRLIELIREAILASEAPAKWYFHFTCEPTEKVKAKGDSSQFFVHGDTVYFDDDGSGFDKLFR